MKTRAIQETVVTTMQTKLNGKTEIDGGGAVGMVARLIGGGGGGGEGGEGGGLGVDVRAAKRAKTETSVSTEQTEMVSYFLLKDHRYVYGVVIGTAVIVCLFFLGGGRRDDMHMCTTVQVGRIVVLIPWDALERFSKLEGCIDRHYDVCIYMICYHMIWCDVM